MWSRRVARSSRALAMALAVLTHPRCHGEAFAQAPEASPSVAATEAHPASTVPDPVAAAVAALTSWVAGVGGRLGVAVVDVRSGGLIATSDEHRVLNPASNTKVLTAAAVLERMGPDHRFTTGLYGTLRDGIVAPLVIRGDGDPSVEMDELWELASAIRQQGVSRVDGVLVDQSRFDSEWIPPAFEQQPAEWAPFRAPVSAVALERNAVTLNVVPGKAGTAAVLWFDPPGFVDVRGTVETRASGKGNGVRLTLMPTGTRLRADVGGFVGEGLPRLRFSKRVDDPRLLPGHALAEVLRQMGVDVRGAVALGGADVHARLAYVESEPLAVLVRELGKNSDNFYAEMLLKSLGAFSRGPPARSQDGADAVVAWLKEVGALEPGTTIRNGSGLFDANRVSAFSLATALRAAYWSPRIGPDFIAQLSVGGVDGTLRARFRTRAPTRAVRAKTGTLDQVVALSGYVLPPPGRDAVAFSFIVEGTSRRAEARQRIDRCVELIAKSLWSG